MLRIIVETTHLVISQYAHDATNNGRVHTSTYITIMSIYAHAFSGKPGKKKTIARRLSSGGRLREQIQHFFLLFSINSSAAVHRSSSAWKEGLVRACRDTKCLSANKHTDQSIWRGFFFVFFKIVLLPLKISVVQSNRPCDLKNSEHAWNPA